MADCPNVYIKLGGLGMRISGFQFHLDKIAASYALYWNAFKRLAAGASGADKAALFRATAKQFYRLH